MSQIEPSPVTKRIDPAKPLSPVDLARLQINRAAARKWVDACEVDVLEQERKLAKLVEERECARVALGEAEEAIQFWKAPVALRRVG